MSSVLQPSQAGPSTATADVIGEILPLYHENSFPRLCQSVVGLVSITQS